ncbi:MAG: M14 family metallopeptidase [Candidatus Paceibacterota bacterium]
MKDTKKIIIGSIVIVLIVIGGYFIFFQNSSDNGYSIEDELERIEENEQEEEITDSEDFNGNRQVIGTSAGGHDIVVNRYGQGENHVVFVGGIHGGYSWNTALVAYELIDYLENDPSIIPSNVEVSVIPALNPDGLVDVFGTSSITPQVDAPTTEETIPGRFNANGVDLNRNFDCDWQANATWQDREVSGGSSAFSEPEAQALRDYIEENDPDAVVVWYAAADGVFASNCHNGVLDETLEITNVYADASGYPAYESFNFYEITGDAVNWLAKEGIPAISILLSNHQDVEWSKNRAGINALLEYFAE